MRRAVPGDWVEHPDYWAVACDYETGRRVPFGRAALARAPTSPTPWRPRARSPASTARCEIGGRRYVDGGVCSVSNLDLLAGRGLDLVICLNPLTGARDGGFPTDPLDWSRRSPASAARRRLEHEGRKVRSFGTEVVIIQPTADRPESDGAQLDERRAAPAGDRDGAPASVARAAAAASRTRSSGPRPALQRPRSSRGRRAASARSAPRPDGPRRRGWRARRRDRRRGVRRAA